MNKRLKKHGIIYPKFTRQENKACKLSEEQIRDIKDFFNSNRQRYNSDKALYIELGKKYNVHYQTIHYWCKKEYRKSVIKVSSEKNKRKWKESPDLVKAEMRRKKADWRKRKADKLVKYNNEQTRNWYQLREEFIQLHKEEWDEYLKEKMVTIKDTKV